jgi:NAD(P)-dependent dehydrogenase (short-subunit alcohol dehydrogenase family)
MRETGIKTCVITGAISGIGLETAKQLATAGLAVIGIGGEPGECRAAEDKIRESGHGAEVRVIDADLSSLADVRGAAAGIRESLPGGRLDRLIHNASTLSNLYRGTEDGYELQFSVNYLAAFLLTRELFPSLARPAEARVITVSSGSHRRTEMAWDDPMFRPAASAPRQSKLALVLFTLELNRRVARRFPVRAIGVEPGYGDADLGGDDGRGRLRRLSPADAATAIVGRPRRLYQGDYFGWDGGQTQPLPCRGRRLPLAASSSAAPVL